MARKDNIILAKEVGRKRLRNRVRLEAAIRADVLLNDVVADFEEEFDRRLAAGEPFELAGYDDWIVTRIAGQLGA